MEILTPVELRIIGALIEKELATPEYYPLTINSLVNACNQKSGRFPVVSYDEKIVEENLESLRNKKFVARVTGDNIRVPKYKQIFTDALHLSEAETAVTALLMLRGPQTPGELKTRSGRMFNFDSLQQVNETLNQLIRREEPLVKILPRQPGMKESRFIHLFSKDEPVMIIDEKSADDRIEKLEEEIIFLKEEVESLKIQFEKFRKEFE